MRNLPWERGETPRLQVNSAMSSPQLFSRDSFAVRALCVPSSAFLQPQTLGLSLASSRESDSSRDACANRSCAGLCLQQCRHVGKSHMGGIPPWRVWICFPPHCILVGAAENDTTLFLK